MPTEENRKRQGSLAIVVSAQLLGVARSAGWCDRYSPGIPNLHDPSLICTVDGRLGCAGVSRVRSSRLSVDLKNLVQTKLETHYESITC